MGRILLLPLVAACIASVSVADDFNTQQIGNIQFTVANGLSVELVAPETLIQWPIAATYHPSGDLLILECHWIKENVPKPKQLEAKSHMVVRLSDTDQDGKYDCRTVIADSLGFPEGIMVLGDSMLVTAPPEILKLSDKDNDGFFETKEVWFDAGTMTGCANDLHGPMMGPDGWVYWTKGAFAEQKHVLLDRNNPQGEASKPSKAAHIYRRHPSGGPIERLMTGGMDNPSDLTFTAEGERIFCSTFMHKPGNGLRDGIGHAPRGGMFGKYQQLLDSHWATGPLLQPIANMGAAAPASVSFLESNLIADSTNWYKTTEGNATKNRFLVSSQFNYHKIGLHRLIPNGSSFETESHDLLSADRVDFHPVDVLEEADGSLLVFDTGGWYDLCCPSSGTDQKVAMGGIYRLKNSEGKKSLRRPSPLSLEQSVAVAMDKTKDVALRKEAMWKMATAITAGAEKTDLAKPIIALLSDSDASIQQTASHIVGLNRWRQAEQALVGILKSDQPATVRAAMEVLGVVGSEGCIDPILAAMNRFKNDRLITHSCIYTLMEIGATESLNAKASKTTNDTELYVMSFALNQLGQVTDGLLRRLVVSMTSKDEGLRALALECLTKNPNGVQLCIPFLEKAWETQDADLLAEGVKIVQNGQANGTIVGRVGELMRNATSHSPKRQDWLLSCLQSIERIPTPWSAPLVAWIQSASNESLLKLAGSIRKAKFTEEDRVAITKALLARAESILGAAPETTLATLAANPSSQEPIGDACAKLMIEQLTAPESILVSQAEAALGRSLLKVDAARSLLAAIDKVPSLQLQTAIDVILRCSNAEIDKELLEKLPQVPALKTLAVEKVIASVNSRPDEFKKQWAAMMQAAVRPPENIADELDAWLKRLPPGDPKKGFQVFSNAKAACSSCHQIGYVGGRLGPELSSIGRTRSRRDLIEAIVYPSLRIAQGYYPVRIRTIHDEVFNGLLSKQTDTFVELLCGADKICRVDKSEIAEQGESKLSVMPSGLDQQIALEDLADLIAFLESKR